MIEEWLEQHLVGRDGERRLRLEKGFGYGERLFVENVWLPAFGGLKDLHPEYEVVDIFEGRRFIDFAFLREGIRVGIEVDGYGPHYAKLSRDQFSNQWVRHMQLMNLGWHLIRISVDDLTDRALLWQRQLQQFLGSHFGITANQVHSAIERAMLDWMFRIGRPVAMEEIERFLGSGRKVVRRVMYGLMEKGDVKSAMATTKRVHRWTLTEQYRFRGIAGGASLFHRSATPVRNRHLGDIFRSR